MAQSFVSLIHGVRRLYRLHPNRQWMAHLSTHLLSHGAASTSCFNWSGGILSGLRGIDATRYAASLLEDNRQAFREGASLSIVAKSLGGLIAEKALALLRDDVQIYAFLRVGVPDARTTLRMPNVSRVVNVTSRNDQLYRFAKYVVPYVAFAGLGGNTTTECVELQNLTHHELTENTILHNEYLPDATTYDLYWRLLNR